MIKLVIFIFVISLTSCHKSNVIYYSKNIDKCIHNLNEMQRWLQEDYQDGLIPEQVANNYMIVLINTKCSLYKKIKEKHTDCVD